MTTASQTEFDVEAVRRDFPILSQRLQHDRPLVYLDTAATSQKPRVVIDKMVECFEHYNSNVHRGIHQLGDRMTTELEAAREKVQRFIGAPEVDEIVFTSGTTMSLNMVAHGWARKFLKPGDEVLVNAMEHHANLVPWQLAVKATGATLKFIPLTADGRLDLTNIDALITTKTKLLAVTAMSNVLGTINPIDELAQRVHAVGGLICVDGAQSVPHDITNVKTSGIDFLAFSGHKLYGPTGIGVLYARKSLLEAMDPFLAGGHMIREVFEQTSTWADPPAKFEAGTCAFVEAVALGTAIDYVQSLGLKAISDYEHQLSAYAHRRLAEVSGLRVLGPGLEHKGAIASFVVDGVHPHDLSDLLDREGVAIRAGHHCTMPLHDLLEVTSTARASFAFYNTTGEVDALIDALQGARKVFRLR
ncbi:aminotransferase class V-fold PLP-dependent enzyme [Schlesneria paludicola]|uniref:aminotransferase class V-fold PLP-dependent enzyme n=1 Tax=Schlesneria paludicola TaxID=360056 RepID=UPI00029A48AF|nr:cysteine desulfurase [Schlesneria paludicola]